MRRLRAAATPAAFFIGLTLLCASIVEFARWPFTWARIYTSDFEVDFEHAFAPDVGRPISAVSERWFPGFWLAEGSWMVLFGVFALLGLERLRRGHQRSGATIIALAAIGGVVPAIAHGLELRLWDPSRFEYPCSSHGLILPPLIMQTAVFAAVIAMVSACAWLLSQSLRGLPLSPGSWVAAGIAICMVGIALLVTADAAERLSYEELTKTISQYPRPMPVAPDRPILFLVALLGAGLALSVTRPLYVSRFVSTLLLAAGLVCTGPALTIAHDAGLEFHERFMFTEPDLSTPKAGWCPAPSLAPVLQVSRNELITDGRTIAATAQGLGVEAATFERLFTTRNQYLELHHLAGDMVSGDDLTFNLEADARTPLSTIEGIGRAAKRAQYHFIDLISVEPTPGNTWTIPTIHKHTCALRIELSDDGQSIHDFADFTALFHAAEAARGGLRVRMLSPAEGSTPR